MKSDSQAIAAAAARDQSWAYSAASLKQRARAIRQHVITQVSSLGEGYISQGLQAADAFAVLFFREMLHRQDDVFLLSNGHTAVAYYATLAELGEIPHAELTQYGRDGARLTLGSEPGEIPAIRVPGGSLGQVLGVACGWAYGKRMKGESGRVWNYMSDGELQEGATWEAAMFAGHNRLGNLINLIDVNGRQSDGPLVLSVEPVARKFEAFGWWALDVDGNDVESLCAALDTARSVTAVPKALVLHTQTGRGSPTVERIWNPHYIHGSPADWSEIAAEVSAGEEVQS